MPLLLAQLRPPPSPPFLAPLGSGDRLSPFLLCSICLVHAWCVLSLCARALIHRGAETALCLIWWTQLLFLTLGVLEEAEFYNITSLIKPAKDKIRERQQNIGDGVTGTRTLRDLLGYGLTLLPPTALQLLQACLAPSGRLSQCLPAWCPGWQVRGGGRARGLPGLCVWPSLRVGVAGRALQVQRSCGGQLWPIWKAGGEPGERLGWC